MSHEEELLLKLKLYKRRVFVLLGISLLLFPYSIYRLLNGHTQSGLLTLLPSILGLAMSLNYLRVILRHEKVLREIVAEEDSGEDSVLSEKTEENVAQR